MSSNDDVCLSCGGPSEVGAHGVRDGMVYSEYWCESCWSKRKRKGKKQGGMDFADLDLGKVVTSESCPDQADEGTLWVGKLEWLRMQDGKWVRVFYDPHAMHSAES